MELTSRIQRQKVDYTIVSPLSGKGLFRFLISIELFSFMLFLAALIFYRVQEPEIFIQSTVAVINALGRINAIVLLSSALFMFSALYFFKKQKVGKGINYLFVTLFIGSSFLIMKWFDFNENLNVAVGLEEQLFFLFYWFLAGFHFLHVIVGLVIYLIKNS